jgi:hypothetical protein
MLGLIISWLVLLVVSFEVGSTVLDLIREPAFKRVGDRFVIAVWLGILVVANMLLAMSVITSLSLFKLLVLSFGLILSSLFLSRRLQLETLRPYLSTWLIVSFAALLLTISYVTTQVVTWYDTGGYHFGIIKWLSKYGSVPGLALLYYGFGYTSSWFALAASFNDWIFDARASTLTGGFAFLMVILHLWMCLVRVVAKRAKVEDWFIIIASLLALSVITRYEIYVSPSQDLPVIILTLVTAWSIIVATGASSQSRLTPLLLSAGAVSIKLSAVPLWMFSSCLYLVSEKFTIKRILTLAGISFFVLFSFLTVQMMTSGCFLYPSSLVCLDLPWTIGGERTKEVMEQILKAAQWSSVVPPERGSWDWALQWIVVEKYQTALILLAIFCFLFLKRDLLGGLCQWVKWVLAMGIGGFVYTLFLGPTWRYSLGYLVIIPGAILSLRCARMNLFRKMTLSCHQTPPICLSLLSIIILLVSIMVNNLKPFNYLRMEIAEAIRSGGISTASYDKYRVLLPPKILNFNLEVRYLGGTPVFSLSDLTLIQKQSSNVNYFKPTSGYQCWDAELPCSQALTYDNIDLRDPRRGIAGGFILRGR